MTTTDTTPATTAGEPTDRESGRHPVNVGHLVMGIALLGLVAVWALIVGDVVEGEDVRWLLPAPWVLAGGAGLVAIAVTGRRGRESRQPDRVAPVAETEPAGDAPPEAGAEPREDGAPLAPDSTDSTDSTEEEQR